MKELTAMNLVNITRKTIDSVTVSMVKRQPVVFLVILLSILLTVQTNSINAN